MCTPLAKILDPSLTHVRLEKLFGGLQNKSTRFRLAGKSEANALARLKDRPQNFTVALEASLLGQLFLFWTAFQP